MEKQRARSARRPCSDQCSSIELISRVLPSLGTRTIPEELILRDALYILQGVDGRFVRFIISPSEPNPYLVRPENETAPQVLVFSRDDEVRPHLVHRATKLEARRLIPSLPNSSVSSCRQLPRS